MGLIVKYVQHAVPPLSRPGLGFEKSRTSCSPHQKKKAATNTSSYKGRRKLVSSGGEIASRKPCAKNRSASHSHVPWPACSHKREHAFAGSSESTSSRRLGRLKRWEDRRGSKSTRHMKELEGNLMTKSSPILQASSSMSKLPPGRSEGPILCAFISH